MGIWSFNDSESVRSVTTGTGDSRWAADTGSSITVSVHVIAYLTVNSKVICSRSFLHLFYCTKVNCVWTGTSTCKHRWPLSRSVRTACDNGIITLRGTWPDTKPSSQGQNRYHFTFLTGLYRVSGIPLFHDLIRTVYKRERTPVPMK